MPIDPNDFRTGGALQGAVAASIVRQQETAAALAPGTLIGIYRVLRELGRGGMAIVYLAERADGEYEQRVALKWMQSAQADAASEALFRRERQALADLRHPHVARLLDGGRSEDGRPWFAMEYIEGERLDRHCVQAALPTSQRLQLFLQVCAAVAFAHARGVIHRDIKPSNVLVDADGSAKLLDFGIAQLLGQDDPLASRAYTPGFASPEQVRGETLTIASDVYQLGRLLASLLSSDISEQDTVAATASAPPRPGDDYVLPLPQHLPADLVAILRHATATDPARRYATASDFAADVQALLARRPVSARDATPSYRATRFVQRNGVATALVGLALIALVASAIAFAWRLADERDRAQHQANRADEVTQFLLGLFRVSDPGVSRGDTLTANQILDLGTSRLQTELNEQTATRAAMLEAIGTVHVNLGQAKRAEPLLQQAVTLTRDRTDVPASDRARYWQALATSQWQLDRYDEALASVREGRRLIAGRTDLAELQARLLNTEAVCELLLGRFERTVALERESIALIDAQLGPNHELAGFPYHNLADALSKLGREDEALDALAKGLATVKAGHGEHHPDVHSIGASYGRQLARAGRYDEAWPVLQAAQAGLKATFGEQHWNYANSLLLEAEARTWARDHAAALRLAEQAHAIFRGLQQPIPRKVARSFEVSGFALSGLGRHADALARQQQALAIRLQQLSADHVDVARSRYFVGIELCRLDQLAAARDQLTQALQIRTRAFPAAHPAIAETRTALTDCAARNDDTNRQRDDDP